MRYHYQKPKIYFSMYGEMYVCDHPVYDVCTLYLIGDRGLAVIQQRFDSKTKTTWWTDIDPWLTDELYLHPRFITVFDERAERQINELYPTITLRQLMWKLRMKPIKRERWETTFDKQNI